MQFQQILKSVMMLACVLALFVGLQTTVVAQKCGPVNSPGNPYPCGNGGNCTFYSWHQAKYVWGQILPGWGNAKTWADSALKNGNPVSSEPGSKTIGVSGTLSEFGHVWWNDFITWDSAKGNIVRGSEMMWGIYGVNYNLKYPLSTANRGYIYPKPSSSRPKVSFTVSPTLWASSKNQNIGFAGSNFKPGMVVDVTFPNGGMTTLQGSQVQYSSGTYVSIMAMLNSRGWWKFRLVAGDGQRSDPVWVYVN
jgi:surface antigen